LKEEIVADNFADLTNRLAQIDLFGKAGEPMPLGNALSNAVKEAAPMLPPVYVSAYADPLEAAMRRLTAMARTDPTTVETLTGAVYQHHAGNPMEAPLDRFLAVISNLYRSFLDKNNRESAGVPLTEMLPPLAMFQNDGQNGPFTLPVDAAEQVIGAAVGVVSMPATYAEHPIIWAALAHETGGHDVTHADPDLLPELGRGISAAFAGMPTDPSISRDDLARLWSYWIDESAADAYGVLNVGPAFAPNLAAFFGALNARATGGLPALRMESGFSQNDPNQLLDPHPTDIVRLHLAIGVIETLTGLSAQTRATYVQGIEDLANKLATGDTVRVVGNIPVDGQQLQPLDVTVPLAVMQQAARNVGGFIATARLNALNGHSIQDIETWDDADEAKAQAIKTATLEGRSARTLGDDAQLMAGATLAVLDQPAQYDAVTRALNEALDRSFQTDPIWGTQPADAAYIRYAKDLTLRK
jgi:hypothetical protein